MDTKIIKFRGWDKSEKKMWKSDTDFALSFSGNETYYLKYSGHYLKTVDFVIMEFTGKKDSKGIEMYLGDIILTDFDNEFGSKVRKNGKIIWCEGNSAFEVVPLDDPNGKSHWGLGNGQDSVVVGNIYSNPELLK